MNKNFINRMLAYYAGFKKIGRIPFSQKEEDLIVNLYNQGFTNAELALAFSVSETKTKKVLDIHQISSKRDKQERMQAIQADYRNGLTLAELSEKYGLHRNYISSVLRKEAA